MAHRLTGGATIGLVVAVLLLFAAAGAAVALMVRGSVNPSPLPTFPQTGKASPATSVGPLPMPTRETGPSPTAADRPSTGGQLIEADIVSIVVPGDWRVDDLRADRISLKVGPGGPWLSLSTTTGSRELDLSGTPDFFLAGYKDKFATATLCEGPKAAAVPGGPPGGLGFSICVTDFPSSGEAAISLVLLHRMGNQGTTSFLYLVTHVGHDVEAVITLVGDLPVPVWKQYRP